MSPLTTAPVVVLFSHVPPQFAKVGESHVPSLCRQSSWILPILYNPADSLASAADTKAVEARSAKPIVLNFIWVLPFLTWIGGDLPPPRRTMPYSIPPFEARQSTMESVS